MERWTLPRSAAGAGNGQRFRRDAGVALQLQMMMPSSPSSHSGSVRQLFELSKARQLSVAFAGAPLAYGRGKTVEIRPRVRAGDAKRRDNDDREKGQPHRALHLLRLTLTPRTPP